MKQYYLGIDGGGTKTAFLLTDADGRRLAFTQLGTSSYKQLGVDGVGDVLCDGIRRIWPEGVPPDGRVWACFGMPMYGENTRYDAYIEADVRKRMPWLDVRFVNDAEVGWAGSLGLEPGINIVAGTGSIAFGRNEQGQTARCGGWSEFFSDEGSCYWLGRKTVELFSRQADWRVGRGALYDTIRRHFRLDNDYDIIGIIEADYKPRRDKVASLQLLLQAAARDGDTSAASLYVQAAGELAGMVQGVRRQLGMPADCRVSYSGGLFKAGAFIQKPFANALPCFDIRPPVYPPHIGAVLLAALHGGGDAAALGLRNALDGYDLNQYIS